MIGRLLGYLGLLGFCVAFWVGVFLLANAVAAVFATASVHPVDLAPTWGWGR